MILSKLNECSFKGSIFEINGNIGFNQSLITYSHDNRTPHLIMILCGGNNRNVSWSFNYKILYRNETTKISGGTYNIPLKIEFTDKLQGVLSITPLGFHEKKLKINIIE